MAAGRPTGLDALAGGVGDPPQAGSARLLPCTILSGFLGSGKTSLLTHILRNKQGLRCAVIVNDMAELNIDASLVKNAALVQAEERLVEMSNGCICCTLREDLAVEVGRLAAARRYDYCIIESTGIGEPMQVAETFAMATGEGGYVLADSARLDTTVTVVDAANLMANFASVESLRDRGEQADEEDERGVAELLLDQIEFADVVLLNKVDLVSAEEQRRLLGLLHTLNPGADVIPTQHARVPLTAVINTGRFSMEKAARSAGWLKTLQDGFTPETEEYDISSIVYRARRPFHPARLHDFLNRHFVLQEPDWSEALAAEQERNQPLAHCDGCQDRDHSHVFRGRHDSRSHLEASQLAGPVQQAVLQASQASQQAAAALQSVVQHHAALGSGTTIQQQALLATVAAATSAAAAASSAAALLLSQLQLGNSGDGVAAALDAPCTHGSQEAPAQHHRGGQPSVSAAEAQQRQALLTATCGQLLRSKGFVWLATRPNLCGEWSQAGGILRLGMGGPWYAALPDEAWPQEEEHRQAVLKDFQGQHGDRRQELVLIGVHLNGKALTAALDGCLCSECEMRAATAWQLVDPFAEWPTLQQVLDGGQDEEQEEEDAVEELESAEGIMPCPQPGAVHDVTCGAAELQQCFNGLVAQRAAEQGAGPAPAPALGVVSWHADWCEPCRQAAAALCLMAVQHHAVAFFTLDVEASSANSAFALEKVLRKAESRRAGAKPLLKSHDKLPCITLHYLPSLQPVAMLAGPTAVEQLKQALLEHACRQPVTPAAALQATVQAATGPGSSDGQQQSAAATAAAEPSKLVVLKKGATEAKELLAAGRARGTPVLVVWTQSNAANEEVAAGAAALLAAAAEAVTTTHGLVLVDADAAASKANELLAGALRVRSFPEVHVYCSMKLDSKLTGTSATPAKLLRLAAQLMVGAARIGGSSSNGSIPPLPVGATAAVLLPPAPAMAAPGPFDPPASKFAKPGATKRFSDGRLGHFFPKMPCLRCGCPWWTNEDWDARCLRCGWDCERSGYDDNSQPLPKHRAKWEHFVAAIRAGHVPAWAGKAKN
ncbi:hypothetical protein CHLNCDRAFT_58985 [Chlorella variabilis]|uniref:CobW C-terminal domain-containing protein n=1 Tax=Chlorella variabilis TaxID=554065 RepID=E1ZPY5_CHLVA|nr:hypothetical protein CHLNCDRAFT_58985 [Chlorella variabilis]EFN52146.1 hypothetical protein CHLNCDRAFT_58985 [Chlorella variabilis]|eukprot:XP_005844248.1 hypothetical protein CHLNCDRAFT_58985 [Chlorella variabilis]